MISIFKFIVESEIGGRWREVDEIRTSQKNNPNYRRLGSGFDGPWDENKHPQAGIGALSLSQKFKRNKPGSGFDGPWDKK